MTAHSRIQAAEQAMATGHLHALASKADPNHEAAVELEARRLLTETRVQLEREIREEIGAEIGLAIAEHRMEFPTPELKQFRQGMREARRVVMRGLESPLSPRSHDRVCRDRWLDYLRTYVEEHPGPWSPARVKSVLFQRSVSSQEALTLLDTLTSEGVLVRDAARGQWATPGIQKLIDAERAGGELR